MTGQVTPEEVHAWFKEHFHERPDIGVWKATLDLILDPPNPFEPEQRRLPTRGFRIGASVILVVVGWFVYFNFVH